MYKALIALLLFSGCFSGNEPVETFSSSLERQQLVDSIFTLQRRIDSLKNECGQLSQSVKVKNKKAKRKGKQQEQVPVPLETYNAYYSEPAPVQRRRSTGSSGRCQGMTKKGYQCSRSVKSGSYCWQHGG